jgi:hypothetical protein
VQPKPVNLFSLMIAQNTRFGVRYGPSIVCFSPRLRFVRHFFQNFQFPSQYALKLFNGRKWSNIACYTCCEIAISPIVSQQFSNGLHRWIRNWKRIISGIKKMLNFKGYISGGQKNPTFSRYTIVLLKPIFSNLMISFIYSYARDNFKRFRC